MSGYDVDRTLADWFHADALVAEPTDGVDRALEGARRHKPRPAWLAGRGSHWGWAAPGGGSALGVRALQGSRVRWSTAVILVLALGVLLVGAILIGARLLERPSLPNSRLGQLAYADDGDIFVADWDGRNPARIADGLPDSKSVCGRAGYGAEGQMWSPDGRYLAYRSPRSQVVCERPASDLIPTVILSDPTGHVVAEVHGVGWHIPWSPDSTRVATWLGLYPMTRIGVYGLDGVRQTVLTLPSGLEVFGEPDPVWSPDGESLLIPIDATLTRCHPDQYPNCKYAYQIWELPVDGRPARPLPSDDPRSHSSSSRSPDGTRVAYVADEGRAILDFGEAELVVSAADGSQPRVLFTAGADDYGWTFPVWSQAGDRIAFVARDTDLRVVDVASGSVTTLVPAADGEQLSLIAFSPEGDRILFARHDADWEAESLWTVDADGSDPRLLVSGTGTGDWQSLPADQGPSDTRSTSSTVGLP